VQILKRLIQIACGVAGMAVLVGLAPRVYTAVRFSQQMYDTNNAPAERVAVVFGAGLQRDGSASAVLWDRVATAAALYQSGKVSKLLLSGDNRFLNYNEPQAMYDVAVQLGVPAGDLVMDYAGRSTYDTCYRAHAIFGLTRAVLVTQAFHLPRALYLCDALGMQAFGVQADRRTYLQRTELFWNLREIFATAAAWWDLNVARPLPVLGEPIPIAN
jgi:SanA protein